tara:strand:- start:378 stop:623 length:246 start_codon:yes stop_codon:yes gene_type:complete
MTITLPPALDELVARKMATGLYQDASDVVREALREMAVRESTLERVRSEAAVGFDQLERGEFREFDQDTFLDHFHSRRDAR